MTWKLCNSELGTKATATVWGNTRPYTQSSACKRQWSAHICWGWSKVSPASPRNMRKAATTLPDSDTGFFRRVFGKIWPSIVPLQNVLLTLTHPCFSCGSYHMKHAKVNILRQLSLSPYRQLKHVNCRSWKARQSALIVEKMSSLQRDPSPFHIPAEPAVLVEWASSFISYVPVSFHLMDTES